MLMRCVDGCCAPIVASDRAYLSIDPNDITLVLGSQAALVSIILVKHTICRISDIALGVYFIPIGRVIPHVQA